MQEDLAMPIEDENEVEVAAPQADPILPRPDQRDRYWEVVRRIGRAGVSR